MALEPWGTPPPLPPPQTQRIPQQPAPRNTPGDDTPNLENLVKERTKEYSMLLTLDADHIAPLVH